MHELAVMVELLVVVRGVSPENVVVVMKVCDVAAIVPEAVPLLELSEEEGNACLARLASVEIAVEVIVRPECACDCDEAWESSRPASVVLEECVPVCTPCNSNLLLDGCLEPNVSLVGASWDPEFVIVGKYLLSSSDTSLSLCGRPDVDDGEDRLD